MSTFASLFVPDELREAVSGCAWLEAMLDAERSLANAGALAGVVPAEEAAAIAEACCADAYDWERLLREGRRVGNPVEPLVRALAERVGPGPDRWVHRGATSQDVMDTAAMLVAHRALGHVLGDLDRVAEACATLARKHRDTPMAGRTLLQHAVPTTFGLKTAGWLVAVLDVTQTLAQLRQGLPAQLGGAAGTLAGFGADGLEVERLFAHELGLAERPLPWHTNRVPVAELGAALGIAAGALAKIGLDLVLLAQTEVAEVREGGEGGGSSTMPQKRNPIGAASTRACAALAQAGASVLTGALAQEHERAAGAWHAEWEALCGALAYAGAAAATLASTLEELEVDEARMRANLDLTGGQIAAERLASVLTDTIGRAEARELVRAASLRAASTGRPLADEVLAENAGLDAAEIAAALDSTTYLGSAGVLVDRALALFDAESRAKDDA